MALIFSHPEVAARSCIECSQYAYSANGRKSMRAGKPVELPPGSLLPCGWSRKDGDWKQLRVISSCPKVSPVDGKGLSAKNWQAFRYYLEIKAGAVMPNDRIVRRNCALIRWAEDAYERGQAALLPLALGIIGKTK